jgi:aspartyl-tRNA synthetase
VKVEKPVTACSQSDVELSINQFFVVSRAEPQLPIQIEDASRRAPEKDYSDDASKLSTVDLDTRLDNR